MRATNGTAATVRGTMAAVVPMEVPTIARVKGIIATIKIMNGSERPIFTTAESMRLITLFGHKWSGSVTTKMTPRGKPNT